MKIKKYIIVLLLVVLIAPSVALASWWNPLSWGIFNFLHKKEASITTPEVEKDYEAKINELQKQIEDLKNSSVNTVATTTPSATSIADQVKAQVAKELKSVAAKSVTDTTPKTLSEQVGVSKASLQACINATDKTALNTKIQASVEAAMKAVPEGERGTPYSIIIGNGVKTEIRGATSVSDVENLIAEVKSGKVTTVYGGDVAVTEAGDHIFGNPNAPIKIIEYSDLECPFCKMFNSTMKQVIADSNGNVSWVYRHWPIHQNSMEKLVAAECVAKIKGNDAFWKYVDLLFGLVNTGSPSVTDQL